MGVLVCAQELLAGPAGRRITDGRFWMVMTSGAIVIGGKPIAPGGGIR